MNTQQIAAPLSESEGALDDLSQQLKHAFAAEKWGEAQELCRAILERDPDHARALHILGAVYAKLGQFEDAVHFIGRALKADPTSAAAWNGHGSALRALKRTDEALASYNKAIALKPDFAQAFFNRAGLRQETRRFKESLLDYDKAIALSPQYARALTNRAGLLHELGRLNEALHSYDKATALDSAIPETWTSRGIVLQKLGRLEEALTSYDSAIFADSDHADAVSLALTVANQLCIWTGSEHRVRELKRLLHAGKRVGPLPVIQTMDLPQSQLDASRNYWLSIERPGMRHPHDIAREDGRLRIAYVSADFGDHPVGHAIAELIELHDRDRFEVLGVSLRGSDNSSIRKRLEGAFDRFIDVSGATDEDTAQLLAEIPVDIAIDLNGHTTGQRQGIFARRPAPIAVNYLGYPGTSGSEYIDYIVADRHVIPHDSQRFFSEKIAYLPDTYFVTDSNKQVGEGEPVRSAHGLPEQAFVFCCFNHPSRIAPEMLTLWARLLNSVENSVLWLSATHPVAIRNLSAEIEARGVSASRLICAPFLKNLPDHLARLPLADMFLDTLPYNAHSTGCDALFAGVPVLTCSGQSFAARVAGSLLQSVGLPELITESAEDYEAMALKLAKDPTLLRGLRQKLVRNRATFPLFHTARTARHLEAAYRTMWDRYRQGLPPDTFDVERIEEVPITD